LAAVLACAGVGAHAEAAPQDSSPPAGTYLLDKTHASLVLRVDHLGLSNYTLRFTRLDATLDFDPADLARSSVKATIDARSIETDFPEPERVDFDAQLRSEQWLDTARFPEMRYESTRVQLIGANRLRIDGELTLHGVTRSVPLEATFNGGFARHPLGGNAQIGFSATGSLKRSDFGITFALPPPKSTFGVGDEISIALELEFSKPKPATP
jgi:polyisoprenoid-binding protein YceI